jgi:hypothetical protein
MSSTSNSPPFDKATIQLPHPGASRPVVSSGRAPARQQQEPVVMTAGVTEGIGTRLWWLRL